MKVRITLLDDVLGSAPANKEIYTEYIALNNPNYELIEDEIETIPNGEKGITVFPRGENLQPIIFDYQIRGFFKESIGALIRCGKDGYEGAKYCSKIKAYKKFVDLQLFVTPREIEYTNIPSDWEDNVTYCERPLRASTPMGERIALAKSEIIPAGAQIEFNVNLLSNSEDHKKAIIEALDYGQFHGLGQWRNSGKGRFTYEIIE